MRVRCLPFNLFGTVPLLTVLCLFSPPPSRAQSVQPSPEIRALLDRGKTEEKASHKDAATRLYQQALQTARAHKDRDGEAAALVAQGHPLLYDQTAQAQNLFEQALPIYQEVGDKTGQAKCLFSLGVCAALRKQTELAMARYAAATRLYQETADRPGQALTLLMTGNVYHDTGQSVKALSPYAQAVELFRELGDKGHLSQALVSLSRSYLDLHDTTHGRQFLEQARALVRETGDRPLEIIILHNLAGVLAYDGEYAEAREAFQQVLPMLEATATKDRVAGCLNNLSYLSFRLGDYLKSLEYAYRALEMQREIGDKTGIAITLDALASCHSYLGRQDLALDLQKQALQTSRDISDLSVQAQILSNLGRIYGKMRQAPEEREYETQALELYRKLGDRNGEAISLYFLAGNRLAAGDRAQAQTLIAQARPLLERTGDRDGLAAVLRQSGDLAFAAGRRDEARSDYKQALQLYQAIGYVFGQVSVLTEIGAMEEQRGDLSEAQRLYARALALQEDSRASLGGLTETKFGYQASRFPLYQRYIRLLLQTGQDEAAFQWTQKAKARVLIDLMASAKWDISQSMTAQDRRQEDLLKRRGKALWREWLDSLSDMDDLKRAPQPDRKRLKQAEKQAHEIQREQQQCDRDWRAFRERLYLRHPRLAEQRAAHTVTLAEAAAIIPEDTALMEYIVLRGGQDSPQREEVALFVVTRKNDRPQLNVYRLKTAASALARRTQELREACAGRPDTPAERPYKDRARALYQLLIAPAESALAGKRRLILCPDGPLWDTPFQALLTAAPGAAKLHAQARSVFLWERYALVYAYSATGVKAALDTRLRPNRPRPRQALLIVANPDFGRGERASAGDKNRPHAENVASVRGLYQRSGGGRALPNTQVEADAILASFPSAALKTGRQAQETLVKQIGGNYRYLHFATHAIFNDAAPMLSGVELAQPPENSLEDGILTARELGELNLSADMITLSACETARGAQQPGEGILGLTWAAFVAGVPTQVVSQWSIDDAATALLMGNFYHELKQGKEKDAALRSAALAMLRDGRHAHPFYWAPFLIMGDWH